MNEQNIRISTDRCIRINHSVVKDYHFFVFRLSIFRSLRITCSSGQGPLSKTDDEALLFYYPSLPYRPSATSTRFYPGRRAACAQCWQSGFCRSGQARTCVGLVRFRTEAGQNVLLRRPKKTSFSSDMQKYSCCRICSNY